MNTSIKNIIASVYKALPSLNDPRLDRLNTSIYEQISSTNKTRRDRVRLADDPTSSSIDPERHLHKFGIFWKKPELVDLAKNNELHGASQLIVISEIRDALLVMAARLISLMDTVIDSYPRNVEAIKEIEGLVMHLDKDPDPEEVNLHLGENDAYKLDFSIRNVSDYSEWQLDKAKREYEMVLRPFNIKLKKSSFRHSQFGSIHGWSPWSRVHRIELMDANFHSDDNDPLVLEIGYQPRGDKEVLVARLYGSKSKTDGKSYEIHHDTEIAFPHAVMNLLGLESSFRYL